MEMSSPQQIPITILGAGITGLATAYYLTTAPSKYNYKITIIARDLPGDLGHGWASPWAGAIFQPQPTAHPLHQRMQKTSFNFYHSLANSHPSSETGVKLLPCTEYFDSSSPTSSIADESNTFMRSFLPDFRVLSEIELESLGVKQTGVSSGVRYTSIAINPTIFLLWLRKELEHAGIRFFRKEISDFSTAKELSLLSSESESDGVHVHVQPRIIINATGVGAKTLAHDKNVRSIRGQTLFVKSDWEELVIREGSEYTYVIPRLGSGGVVLGGVKEISSVETDASEEVRRDILRRVNLMTGGAFEGVWEMVEGEKREGEGGWMDIVGFRPGREGGMRVEVEGDGDGHGEMKVVHAYGMGGAGYIYSFGVAERVGELVGELVGEMGLAGKGNE